MISRWLDLMAKHPLRPGAKSSSSERTCTPSTVTFYRRLRFRTTAHATTAPVTRGGKGAMTTEEAVDAAVFDARDGENRPPLSDALQTQKHRKGR